ncbi:MAG: 2-dehydropantoate 2-reductase N-terminal domain-containing protein [Gammaproteobacteria bacterium]|nr:2-dehydropantoate 2-reductase N-terminal domain-containing protein [Gammaproteobacteria bacterium]
MNYATTVCKFTARWGDVELQPRLVTRAELTDDYDIILLTCKAYDLASAIETIAPAVGKATRVLPLLNGLAHLPVLDERFGRERIHGRLSRIWQWERRDNGHIHHLNDFHRLVYGSRHASQDGYAAQLTAILNDTALDCERAADIEQALWNKFIFLTTLCGCNLPVSWQHR